jgi:hypothetical protein
MMRKTILALFMFALGTTVFAFDMTIGIGGVFGFNNEEWHWREDPPDFPFSSNTDYNYTQYGGFAFFGTRFTEFNFSLRLSKNEWYVKRSDGNEFPGDSTTLAFSVGAYLKYPFNLGNRFVLFPTIGVDFDTPQTLLYLWIRGGLGIDFFFTERFFIRGQGLYGLGMDIGTDRLYEYEGLTIKKPFYGPLFKAALGWMF